VIVSLAQFFQQKPKEAALHDNTLEYRKIKSGIGPY
jgi:hypothetical protein